MSRVTCQTNYINNNYKVMELFGGGLFLNSTLSNIHGNLSVPEANFLTIIYGNSFCYRNIPKYFNSLAELTFMKHV